MLSRNNGTTDRIIRIALGNALLSLLAVLDGPVRFTGLIGLVPVITAATGWCPIYATPWFKTCPLRTVSN